MKQSVKQIIKYGIVGVVGLGVEWAIFLFLRDFLHLNYILAHIVGCICAIVNNFLLNSYFTFKATDRIWVRAVSFFSIAAVGLLVSVFILPLLVKLITVIFVETELFDIEPKMVQNIAKLITTVVIACLQFVLNKYYTFKKKTSSVD